MKFLFGQTSLCRTVPAGVRHYTPLCRTVPASVCHYIQSLCRTVPASVCLYIQTVSTRDTFCKSLYCQASNATTLAAHTAPVTLIAVITIRSYRLYRSMNSQGAGLEM
jgi:hypothetical protein